MICCLHLPGVVAGRTQQWEAESSWDGIPDTAVVAEEWDASETETQLGKVFCLNTSGGGPNARAVLARLAKYGLKGHFTPFPPPT